MQTIDQVVTQVMTADQKTKFVKECEDKSVADLRAEYQAKLKANRDIFVAARADRDGEDKTSIVDFSKVESMKDMPESERMAHFQAETDRLNIMGAVLHGRDYYANVERNLTAMPDHTGDAPAYSPGQVDAIMRANMVPPRAESMSDLFARQPEHKKVMAGLNPGQHFSVRMDGVQSQEILAATFKKSDGYPAPEIRSGRVELADARPVQLIDMLPQVPALNGQYIWMQQAALSAENASNRNPSEKAEDAAAGEMDTNLTQKKVTVEKVVGILPVTNEQLRHVAGVNQFLDMFMPREIRRRVDYQAINGDGSTPNLAGFPGSTGINTYAAPSSSKILDVLVNGVGTVWVDTHEVPNLLALPWAEYQKIITTKDSQNRFLFGDPSGQRLGAAVVWGLQTVICDQIGANTGYLMNTADKLFVVDGGVELEVGLNSDDFAKGRVTYRVTIFCNFADVRPTSTCSLTALNNAT